jgi:hypothetical protein
MEGRSIYVASSWYENQLYLQVWKTYTLNQNRKKVASSKEDNEAEDRYADVSMEADSLATSYLGAFILPILVGYNLYSLTYLKHTSW